jgi:lipoprotein-anchoring transpeptidase ErfK/SrfK
VRFMFPKSPIRISTLHVATAAGLIIASACEAGARETVSIGLAFQPGTIVVRTSERRLYFVLGNGAAVRYRVAVGKTRQAVVWPRGG